MKRLIILLHILAFFAISCASSDSAGPGTAGTDADSKINDDSKPGDDSSTQPDNSTGNDDSQTGQPDNGTQPDDNVVNDTNNPQPDTNTGNDTNPQPDNEPVKQSVCGDSKIEGLEICEGDTPCSDLPGMTGGTIKCASDCRSVDPSECTIKAQKYGEISIVIDINYDPQNSPGATDPMLGFADGSRGEEAGYLTKYKQKKGKSIDDLAPMDGWFMDDAYEHTIPYSNPNDIAGTPGQMEILPIHYFYEDGTNGYLEIDQIPYKIGAEGGMKNLLKNPIVSIYIMDHNIKPGDYSTGFGVADIYIFKYPETEDSTDTPCVIAMAFSTEKMFKVASANNLLQREGGEIEITGDKIPLYHPTDTPMGDQTDSIVNGWGMRVCSDSEL